MTTDENLQTRQEYVPEILVQEYLSRNLDLLGLGTLKLVSLEHQVPSGRIDILATASDGSLIVIEVKRGKASREAIGQLQAYIGDLVMEHHPKKVLGVLVASGLDQGAASALFATDTINFWQYQTQFSFTAVKTHRPAKTPQSPQRHGIEKRFCYYCAREEPTHTDSQSTTRCMRCNNIL